MKDKKRNPNHPKKGSITKAEPIREMADIERIKMNLASSPRDQCYFILGINTAYRANELLSITCGQVVHLKSGDTLNIMQRKTKRYRATTINGPAYKSIQRWLSEHPDPVEQSPLFLSRSGGSLRVPTISSMVKRWCHDIDLHGNYSSHTMRKTWGYQQLRRNRTTAAQMLLPILMLAYGHTRQEQTLDYLCVQSDEIAKVYLELEL